MNKVVTINLNGNAYQLEEGAYEALRDYLAAAARQLAGNPDQAEIIADIEQAIADKCRAALGAYQTVISTAVITTVLAEMGPVDAGAAAGEGASGSGSGPTPEGAASAQSAQAGSASADPASVKRLYRLTEGAMIGGVCNGLAAYFGVDPTIVRVLFVLLAFLTFGVAVGGYLLMMIVVPAAQTTAEKAAATGFPNTAQEFIRRAREGYYQGIRTLGDKAAHREWKRRFREDMRGWRRHMRAEMREARWHWWQHGAAMVPPEASPAAHLLWALSALFRIALTVVFVWAIVTLMSTGAVFGVPLPADLPLWAGVLMLALPYAILSSAFRLRWRGSYCGGVHPLLWLATMALGIWLADRYVPHFHQMLLDLPPFVHQVADNLRAWWGRH